MSATFTTRFQKALAASIETLLDEWMPGGHELEVDAETKPIPSWGGRPDVWVGRKNSKKAGRLPRIVNIEIEHWSGPAQAIRNINWVDDWVKKAGRHRGAVLHLVHADANLTDSACTDMFSSGIDRRSARFAYDFRVYEVAKHSAPVKLAQEMVDRYDFQSLLWQQLRFVRLVDWPR